MDVDPQGGDYRMMREPPPSRRELPPLDRGGGGYGGPSDMHHHDRYPQTHQRGPPPIMDFGDQEYSERAAWVRERDYYMEEEMGGRGPPPPMDYRYGPPPSEMREMREMPDPRDMRHHDRDYPSPHRGQTMVHRDIL